MLNPLHFIAFICFGVVASIAAKKLTVAAAITGGMLGIVIYAGVGWTGLALLATFFLLGTLATSWKKKTKQSLGLTPENKSGRTTGQVLANGGTGGLFGLLAFVFPQQSSLCLMLMAAAFSSATADTVSSELGSVYGRRFYDILTFKNGRRGDDGVISVEGLLFGLCGSIVIATVYFLAAGWSRAFLWITVAGTVGNLTDSYLGATAERKGIMRNDAVNFLNTLVAALSCFLLQKL